MDHKSSQGDLNYSTTWPRRFIQGVQYYTHNALRNLFYDFNFDIQTTCTFLTSYIKIVLKYASFAKIIYGRYLDLMTSKCWFFLTINITIISIIFNLIIFIIFYKYFSWNSFNKIYTIFFKVTICVIDNIEMFYIKKIINNVIFVTFWQLDYDKKSI